MKRTLLVLGMCGILIAFAGAQTADPDWFWDKPIDSVQWEGLKKANRNELDALLRNYIGKPFTQELWLEMQAKLYELDWFESIEPQAIPSTSGTDKLAIRFVVKEKPTILSINIDGNNSIKTADILGAATSKTGDFYNAAKLTADDAAIVKLYQGKGYPDAKVSHDVSASDDPSLLVLTYHIVEGEQVSIRTIKFIGNSAITSNTLKGKMTLKESGLFQDAAYSEARLEESKAALLDLYQSKGFIDARIVDVFKEYEKDKKTDKSWLTLTVSISEGKQWIYGGTVFSGNQIFTAERLESLITLKPGSTLNYKKFQQDEVKVEDLYFESGYIYNQISLSSQRDEATSTISFTITITERERAHIENLIIKGNSKTKDFVITREIPLEEGDVFSKAKVLEGLRNLYNLQYFSLVEPEFHQGSAEDLMDLVVNVEEMSTAEVNFGVTLSGLGKQNVFPLSGFVKWNDKNLSGKG
ncbi:MAG: outer membrane protein assembly factor BamA, partial [Spirochaetaceae bacterium]|nr:outer membrane protein assembly factor BamA [Spirochaetaceae bacterium]